MGLQDRSNELAKVALAYSLASSNPMLWSVTHGGVNRYEEEVGIQI